MQFAIAARESSSTPSRSKRTASGTAVRQFAPERLAGGLQLGEVGRLDHPHEVDHALAERVVPIAADDRVQRHAGLARACADLADDQALERLLVDLAIAGDHGAGGAHPAVEVE